MTDEQKQRSLRRLFENFQQRIGGVRVEFVNGIDDADPPAVHRRLCTHRECRMVLVPRFPQVISEGQIGARATEPIARPNLPLGKIPIESRDGGNRPANEEADKVLPEGHVCRRLASEKPTNSYA